MAAQHKFLPIAVAVALLCGTAAAQGAKPASTPATPLVADSQAVAGLRKRAEAAEGGDRAKLFAEVARLEVEEANSKFNGGDADAAQAEVARATQDAQQATQSSLNTHKRMKQTQMSLHELSRRLDGIEHSVSAEDRPPLRKAVEKVQAMATELLEAMFKRK